MPGRRSVLGIALLLGAAVCELRAQDPARVWVNARSGIYHCPGTEHYGNTSRGRYLSEPEARRRGFRPRDGRPCATVTVDTTLIPGPAPLTDGPTGGPRPPESGLVECRVVAVSDGDGIECERQGRVRLIGVDAPELNQHPFGQASAAALAGLAPPGSVVFLEPGADSRDRYRRLLAYAWLDGTMLNWVLIRRGWGVSLPIKPNTRYRAQFDEAEQAASRERLGLWAVDGFRCRPADRRDRRC